MNPARLVSRLTCLAVFAIGASTAVAAEAVRSKDEDGMLRLQGDGQHLPGPGH